MNGKMILSFAGGLCIGAAAGYFAAKELLDRKAEEKVKEAWNDARAYIANREKILESKEEKLKIKVTEKEAEERKEPEKNEAAKGLDIKQLRKDAMKAAKSYRRNVFEDAPTKKEIQSLDADSEDEVNDLLNDLDDDEDYYEEDIPKEDSPLREDPYVIGTDEFVENKHNYDQVTIYFYNNGAIVDDEGNSVDDIDRKIGLENHEELERLWDESGCCLIRNEMEFTDYELLKMDEDFDPDLRG